MRRNTPLMPVSILCAGVIMIVLLMSSGTRASSLARDRVYPPADQTATAVAEATAAIAQTERAYPGGTGKSTPAAQTGTTPLATTPISGTTTTATVVRGTPTAITTSTSSSTTSATPQPASADSTSLEPTSTATPTPTPDLNNLACAPGTLVPIGGSGPPNAGFLLFFNKRVVSGGTVQRDGTFAITLEVGNERAGSYAVEVRVRGTQQLLATRICNVPVTTPTPITRRAGQ